MCAPVSCLLYTSDAADEKYAKVLEEYKTKLKAFQNATHDPWVMKWKYE